MLYYVCTWAKQVLRGSGTVAQSSSCHHYVDRPCMGQRWGLVGEMQRGRGRQRGRDFIGTQRGLAGKGLLSGLIIQELDPQSRHSRKRSDCCKLSAGVHMRVMAHTNLPIPHKHNTEKTTYLFCVCVFVPGCTCARHTCRSLRRPREGRVDPLDQEHRLG